MPRPARVARRFEATVGEGAGIHPALHTPQDMRLVRRFLYRIHVHDTIRLWGHEFRVPAHRMAPHWLWRVRQQTYERDEASALLTCVDRDLPFLEFGGGFGAISVLVNHHLSNPTRHVVVEMDEELVGYLESNRDRNGCRYEVVHAAVSDRPVRVSRRVDFIGQQAAHDGDVEVPNVTPEEILERRGWDRVNVFMDIEGMEIALLDAFPAFFRDHVDVLVLETHGHKVATATVAALPTRLHALGLEAVWTRGRVWAYRRRPDGTASVKS